MGQFPSIVAEPARSRRAVFPRGHCRHHGNARPQPLPEYQDLFDRALLPPRLERGTPYPCSQDIIDETIHPSHALGRTKAINLRDAAKEIVDHNEERRRPWPGTLEAQALERLNILFHQASRSIVDPDIVYKAFRDLDAVFFKGRLFGNVKVRWWAGDGTKARYGCTRRIRPGEAEIVLIAEAIFGNVNSPFQDAYLDMFAALLHEMTVSARNAIFTSSNSFDLLTMLLPLSQHALEIVRTPDTIEACDYEGHSENCDVFCDGKCGHGPYFRVMLHSIHRRAKRLNWLPVIPFGHDYRQRHFMSEEWMDDPF
ncbi:MAG: hypothetical protein Q9217_004179 [Psora testacea]